MEDNILPISEEKSVSFPRLLHILLNRIWLIGIVSFLCAVLVVVGTKLLATPQYQSSATFYVNNSNFSLGDASLGISSGDLTTSRNLVESYIVILNTRETLDEIIAYAGIPYTSSSLRKNISAAAVNETEIFKVTVTSTDPHEAERIASAIAHILPKRIGIVIDGTSARVAEAAVVPSGPSFPSYPIHALIGFLLGFVASVGVITMWAIGDTTITSSDDVEQYCPYPLLASVPDMSAPGKGSYYVSGKKTGKYATIKADTSLALVGPNISFSAAEAYKLLRTKLQFSFADENDCHIIGLSSALSGEGKSLTSINLAFSLSLLNKKVLLIDCDMRRPTLAEKLRISQQPGLSNFLTRQYNLSELIQPCTLKGYEEAFYVIPAGPNPPNPMELLSSKMMDKALDALRTSFDYVILDLPPVGEVSDAMTITNKTDGMLLVVRQNYCDRNALSNTSRQFAFINAKILGVVFNCTSENTGKYGKGYYKHYYRRYYHRYNRNGRTASTMEDEKSV